MAGVNDTLRARGRAGGRARGVGFATTEEEEDEAGGVPPIKEMEQGRDAVIGVTTSSGTVQSEKE